MTIIRRIPWTKQPERAVGVSREALRAFGVVGGFVVGPEWPPRRIVDGQGFINIAVQATPVPVPAYFGLGARVTDAGTTRYYTIPTGSFSSRNFTFLTRVRGSEFGAAGVAMRLLPFGSGTSIFIWRNGTTFDMRINGTDYTGAGTFNLNQWYDIEIVGEAGACTLYVNGVATISGGAAAAGTINGDVSFYDCATTGQTNDYGYTLFCARALTAGERASLRTNPWQLFQPAQQRIWASVAGGVYTLNAETGAYAFTGTDATLLHNYALTLESASYSLTGSNATLLKGLILDAASGSYTLTGSDATLVYNKLLNASSGSYSVTGADANLIYTPASGAYVLNAESGAYVLTGSDVTFAYSGGTITLKAGSWIRYRIIT